MDKVIFTLTGKRILWGISVVVVCLLAAGGVFMLFPGDQVVAQEQKAKVEFKTPLSATETVSIVKRYKLNPTELYYVQGEIQGGYTIKKGEDIDAAIKNLLASHQKFLDVAKTSIEEEMGKAQDANTLQRSSILYKQLNSAADKFKKGEFKINAIELSDTKSINSLQKDGMVVTVSNSEEKKGDDSKIKINKNKEKDFTISSISHEVWAPYTGNINVGRTYTMQTFYFHNNYSDYGTNVTYEHETQVYDRNYADYAGYWSSNMPSAYYDTAILDTLDNFTVGTSRAHQLVAYTEYYTYMELRRGTAATAIVRTKGQIGHRFPSWCYLTWCIYANATTSSFGTITAPSGFSWRY